MAHWAAPKARQRWPKSRKNNPTCDILPRKAQTQNKNYFFDFDYKTCRIRRGFEQLSSSSSWRVMAKRVPAIAWRKGLNTTIRFDWVFRHYCVFLFVQWHVILGLSQFRTWGPTWEWCCTKCYGLENNSVKEVQKIHSSFICLLWKPAGEKITFSFKPFFGLSKIQITFDA